MEDNLDPVGPVVEQLATPERVHHWVRRVILEKKEEKKKANITFTKIKMSGVFLFFTFTKINVRSEVGFLKN